MRPDSSTANQCCHANQNLSDGITIVSGSHMVDFGGTIQTISNTIHGISLNSKAGLDLDAGSQVTSGF
jgi:phosphotransferase system IIA component